MLCHTCTTTTLSASCALNGLLHSLLGMLHSGSKWLKPAKNRFLMWFDEFLRASFRKFTWFPIPVIACPSYSREFHIKLFVAGIRKTSQFHEFYESHFWRVLVIWPNCVLVLGCLSLPEKEKDASKLRIAYGPKQH